MGGDRDPIAPITFKKRLQLRCRGMRSGSSASLIVATAWFQTNPKKRYPCCAGSAIALGGSARQA